MVNMSETTTPTAWKLPAHGHQLIFTEWRGNTYTTGQTTAGPKISLYTSTANYWFVRIILVILCSLLVCFSCLIFVPGFFWKFILDLFIYIDLIVLLLIQYTWIWKLNLWQEQFLIQMKWYTALSSQLYKYICIQD